MNVPEDFCKKLQEEIDMSPIFLLEPQLNLDESTLNRLITTENVTTFLKILKIKLILIHKGKSTPVDFDINLLLNKLSNCDLMTLYNVLFHALLTQKSLDAASNILDTSINILGGDLSEINQQIILYNLEIVCAVINVCSLTKISMIIEKEQESNKIQNLIIKLTRTESRDIQKKILRDLIPSYISCNKNTNLFRELWKHELQNNKFNPLLFLALEQYFMPPKLEQFTLLKEDTFWKKLQENITVSCPILRKNFQYLLKHAINSLLSNNMYIENSQTSNLLVCHSEKFHSSSSLIPNLVHCTQENFSHYKTAWKNFFILCDASNEKQLHLIEPTFSLYSTLNILHSSWRVCLSKLFISHPHSVVVKSVIFKILTENWICDIQTLMQGLSNNFLYENSPESKIGDHIHKYVTELNLEFFLMFLQTLCEIQPSPVAFFHICNSIENVRIPEPNFKLVLHLFESSSKIPHLYIRKGVQNAIFHFFLNAHLTDENIIDENYFNELVSIIFFLHQTKFLTFQNYAWRKLVEFLLPKRELLKDVVNGKLNKMFNQKISLSKKHGIFCALLIDANIVDSNWAENNFSKIISLMKDMTDFNQQINFLIFLTRALDALINPEEIFDSFVVKHETALHILYAVLKIISAIEETNKFDTDVINNTEFILKVVLVKTDLSESFIIHINALLETLKAGHKHISYLLLTGTLIQNYETLLYKKMCPDLSNWSLNMKEAKKTFKIHENAARRKILLNYYSAKIATIEAQLKQENFKTLTESEKILRKVEKYYDKFGSDILLLVLNVLYEVIKIFDRATLTFFARYELLLQRCQRDVFALRTNEKFRKLVSKFLQIMCHNKVVDKFTDFVHKLCLEMFDVNQTISGVRNEIVEKLSFRNMSPELVVEVLVYGPVLRKDQRIEFETCAQISKKEFVKDPNEDVTNPSELDRKTRSKMVSILLIYGSKAKLPYRVKKFQQILNFLKVKYEESAGKRHFGDSQIHLTKLRIMQALHIITPALPKRTVVPLISWLFNTLVNESQQPSIKILIQWLLVRLYEKVGDTNTFIENLIKKIKNLKGMSSTTVFPLLYHILRGKQVSLELLEKCMGILLPFTMGQHFNIRYVAQMTIKYIYESFSEADVLRLKYGEIYKTMCDVIEDTYSEKTSDLFLQFSTLNPSLETIYYDIPRLTNVTQTEWLPPSYFKGPFTMRIRSEIPLTIPGRSNSQKKGSNQEENLGMSVQKKIEIPPSILEGDESRKVVGNLIVVASLIDKLPNLGGLSRTCEVFGVEKYVLHNLQVVKNKEYQSLSMSSENWVETLEVKINDLPNYLRGMKRSGYEIIGAEQTSDSTSLDQFHFQNNTVLLLGNEKEGIPPNLIHLLDKCIEIPQFGQIRSLNVHVAGALFIWEYAKQHR